MKLWENEKVVEALKGILEDYDYLEYDDPFSRERYDVFVVKVTDMSKDRKMSDANNICRKLEETTKRRFVVMGFLHEGGNKNWTHFRIRKPRR